MTALDANPAIFTIFNVVGVASIAAYIWFAILTSETFPEFCLDGSMAAVLPVARPCVPQMGFLAVVAGPGGPGGIYQVRLGHAEVWLTNGWS